MNEKGLSYTLKIRSHPYRASILIIRPSQDWVEMIQINGLRTEPWGTPLCWGKGDEKELAKAESKWMTAEVGGKSKGVQGKRIINLIFLPLFQEGRSDHLCQKLLKN